MSDGKCVNRRKFLLDAASAAALTTVGACFPDVGGIWASVDPLCAEPADGGTPGDTGESGSNSDDAGVGLDASVAASPVAEVYREDSVVETKGKYAIQTDKVQQMLDAVLSQLTGGVDNPWQVLLPDYEPGKRIGLKVNCLNRYLPTSPAMILAIVTSLKTKLGMDPSNIIVWDRRLDELVQNEGYTSEGLGGATVIGTVKSTKDPSGPGYAAPLCGVVCGKVPRLSRILTEQTDFTINCPVLKVHGQSGITAALKNVYGVIDNPADYHKPSLQTALPALYKLPLVRKNFRLTICDALVSVTNGDTDAIPTGAPRRILAARDPIALDSYGLALMNQLRDEQYGSRVAPIDAAVTEWLANAEALGLGTRNYDLQSIRQS